MPLDTVSLQPATALDQPALDRLFLEARTHNGWLDRPVSDDLLRQVYDLARMGPTAVNTQPMRLVFVRTPEGKERLKPALSAGNVEKTMAAPVTAIVGYDLDFVDTLPRVFPHVDARPWFAGNDAMIRESAFRNSSLQGAYLMLAARAVGLDVGPMSGFDAAKVEAEFFPGRNVRANFLCNLGYGDAAKLFPRSPRLDFEDVAVLA
ncbi:malonic semialdehyde reductase [Azospirillum sp. TSO22-1]|uniref:malonic semialdehyde reductase n=1 Tax=Azospirillum sp. TSO22-1 TaxID=716789 RepID=UPI000D60957B|nr:malonic semialdehyde reductase [Azospirillum sp. TSO22-1]PWC40829.1 nitroreductase [Azospirillum sp. TSO22-1]